MNIDMMKIAIGALIIHKVRSLLTILGIVIGVAAVILLVSIGNGLTSIVNEQFEELGTDLIFVMPGKIKFGDAAGREGGPPGTSNNKLTPRTGIEIQKRIPSIIATVPVATTFASVSYKGEDRVTPILGTTSNYAIIRKSPTSFGTFFDASADNGAKKVAIMGQTVLDDLSITHDPTGEKIKIAGQTFRIAGVLEAKGSALGNDQDDLIIIPMSTYERTFDVDKVNYMYVKTSDPEHLASTVTAIKDVLLKTHLKAEDFSVVDPKELLNTASTILGSITAALGGIAAISLVVGGIGIANIMLVSVTERTKEIGLRKAVGATYRHILSQFLAEAIFLSLTGGLVGVLIGTGLSLLLRQFVNTDITWWSIGISFGVSLLVGVTSGMGPAIKAARKDPIDALRYE
ncbi:hypothetical protein A3B56_02170 [Candidatus Roizmanbacteria bacterium RIFCSPLOWO2_01_FULL_45_11]|uniref:Multidrug ABC transporter substrate-binding protein n=1 Tax=Candidatus Roizmanbacteria bacterium RIFCSPLOWO2_01_FULL_45_11 TaxID=1802070 RepID=A0A1F7JC46_9BACT|nr:MAG: hypothetical protein A3B56_02170 [Candidatus Roizmanbacteria bacterium RIFCSPLOWO2_01_FULL_45_11]